MCSDPGKNSRGEAAPRTQLASGFYLKKKKKPDGEEAGRADLWVA